jgi:DNA-binding CsgD family transcriptional regulator
VSESRPTDHQLQVLETYARLGSVAETSLALGISVHTVNNLLLAIRDKYHVLSTIQAYRAAVLAGDLPPKDAPHGG